MELYSNCINDVNLKITNEVKNIDSKCDYKEKKDDEECIKKNYYESFIQILNIMNYKKNNWLELDTTEEFKRIIQENSDLLNELKKKVNELKSEKKHIDRFVIFKLILEFYLLHLSDTEYKSKIKECIVDIDKKYINKQVSSEIFDIIKEEMKKNNNDILPIVESKSFNVLLELIETLVDYCLIFHPGRDEKYMCIYNKDNNVFENISIKIKKINCDDFLIIDKAIRTINLDENPKNRQIYMGIQQFMNDYVYKTENYNYGKCLSTNVNNDYEEENVKYLKSYAKPRYLFKKN